MPRASLLPFLPLAVLGQDRIGEAGCYNHCNPHSGFCDWCGTGNACCREGWSGSQPAECDRAVYTGLHRKNHNHECVTVKPVPTPTPSGAIKSASNGKCLDLPGGNPANGNVLWTWECNGGPNQMWAWKDYKIYWDGGLVWNHCLDVPGGDTTNGSYLWIWECTGSPQQQWSYDATAGNIVLNDGTASKCIDLHTDRGNADGTYVQLWDCKKNQVGKVWDLGPEPTDAEVV